MDIFETTGDLSRLVIDEVDFSNTIISKEIRAEEFTFKSNVMFEGSFFESDVTFENCIFEGALVFRGSHMPERVSFKKCIFRGVVSFAAGINKVTGTDEEETDVRHIKFQSCDFHQYTTFNNRNFIRSPDFTDCNFYQPPHFQNCNVHPGLDFEGSRFYVPKNLSQQDLRHATKAFRRLKNVAKEIGSVERYNEFTASELVCKRRLDSTSIAEKVSISVYQIISDFGRSISRPLFFLVLSTALFSLLLTTVIFFSNNEMTNYWVLLLKNAGMLVSQIFLPFSALSVETENLINPYTESRFGFVVKAFVVLQSLTALTAAALFLFAIRRRFSTF